MADDGQDPFEEERPPGRGGPPLDSHPHSLPHPYPYDNVYPGGSLPLGAPARPASREMRSWLMVTLVVLALFVALMITAAVVLPRTTATDPWQPVLQEVLKTAIQVLGVGALGGLAKVLFDLRRAQSTARNALLMRRREVIATLVKVSHDIEVARSTLIANRSAKTWTECITGVVIPGWAALRDLAHDLRNSEGVGEPVFPAELHLDVELHYMSEYLWALVAEHADNKQRISEMQRQAEDAKCAERAALLKQIWAELKSLLMLNLFLDEENGYKFREDYLRTLGMMRASLTADA